MIRCRSCGEVLVDDVDVTSLTIRGERVPFRRSSDYLACENCGTLRSVRRLRAELVADGRIDADAVVSRPGTEDLRDAVEEALKEIRTNTGRVSESESLEDVDAAFALLHDLAAVDANSDHGADAPDAQDEDPPAPD